jgi:hypothetical protein
MARRDGAADNRGVLQNDRVAFIDMPRLLREIVDEALSHWHVRLVHECSDGSLMAAVDRSGADFVFVSSETVGPADVCRLLEERPRVKVFAIADGGRDGCLYELRPNLVLIDEPSPQSLVQTVLGIEGAERRVINRKGR